MSLPRQSDLYASICPTDEFPHEKLDCVVRALALVTQRAYRDVHAKCKAAGRKDSRRTKDVVVAAVATQLGVTRLTHIGRPTLAQFLRDFPTGRFYVSRRGHAFAVIDGVVHDWQRSRTGPRSRVRLAFALPERFSTTHPSEN